MSDRNASASDRKASDRKASDRTSSDRTSSDRKASDRKASDRKASGRSAGPVPSEPVRFEGSDLETVLRDVRDRLGEDAVIVKAEKVRTRGVAGFFAREVVTVLAVANPRPVWKPAAAPARAATSSRSSTGGEQTLADVLLALADEVSAGERTATAVRAARALPTAAASTTASTTASPPRPASDPPSDPPSAFVDYLANARRLAALVELPSAPGGEETIDITDGRLAGRSGRRRGAPAEAPRTPLAADDQSSVGPARRSAGSGGEATGNAVAPAVADDTDDDEGGRTVSGKRFRRLRPAFADAPRLRRTVAGPVAEPSDEVAAPAADARGQRLRQLGLPDDLVPQTVDAASLAAALAALPSATPTDLRSPGIVVVAGDDIEAAAGAVRMGEAFGRSAADIVLARAGGVPGAPPWLVVTSADDAARRRARWRDRTEAVVVAVGVRPHDESGPWATEVIAALAPTHVRVVVDANADPRLVSGWLASLPRVDAIDVIGAAGSLDPARILRLRIPVASIDGVPASPEVWAGLLLARM